MGKKLGDNRIMPIEAIDAINKFINLFLNAKINKIRKKFNAIITKTQNKNQTYGI